LVTIFQNTFLTFELFPEWANWSLSSKRFPGLSLEKMRAEITYRQRRKRVPGPAPRPFSITWVGNSSSVHGNLNTIRTGSEPDANGLQVRLEFALPEESPLLLWRLQVENDGQQPVFIERLEMCSAGYSPGQGSLTGDRRSQINGFGSNLAFFSNGWQSWNYTGAYAAHDRLRRTRLGPLILPMRVNAGTPQPRQPGHFASDMFGVLGDRSRRLAILAGFLSQSEHFGSLEAWTHPSHPGLRMWANGDHARLDPQKSLSTDWACLCFLNPDEGDPLAPYLDAVARQNGIRLHPTGKSQSPNIDPFGDIPVGWSSWYHFFDQVSASDVRSNLQAAAALQPDLPLDLVQIDDGFQTRVGDWYSHRPSFPQGVSPLAEEIRSAGLTPGLWLAPFLVDPRSRLVQEHPDWLLRGRFNRPVNAGYSFWGTFTTALDLTRPEALAYAQEVVHTAAHDWGFPYLKLDFLYAAALPGRYHDPTRTRAQVLRMGLQALRSAAGQDTRLLGCGCPLGSAIGLLDLMRIGADVAETWRPRYMGTEFYIHAEPDFPSVRNAIHNTLTRAPLHKRWWINDPDALLLRPETDLTLAELQTLASVIALSGGSLFVSDHLPDLPPERVHMAERLLPVIGRRPHVLDWFDAPTPRRMRLDLSNASGTWCILAFFNWAQSARELVFRFEDFNVSEEDFPAGSALVGRDFWNDEFVFFQADGVTVRIAAHGVALLALRSIESDEPQYLGSNLHISQGLEVSGWYTSAGQTLIELTRPGHAEGVVDVHLPNPPLQASFGETRIPWERINDKIYRFHVAFDEIGELNIHCQD
jgi:alpha-galactosidase